MIISNKLFHFFMKFWMLQERKSHFCGIFANFFQCSFKSKMQVLMTVQFFGYFFVGIIWRGGRGFIFKWGVPHGGSMGFDGEGVKKIMGWVGEGMSLCTPIRGNPGSPWYLLEFSWTMLPGRDQNSCRTLDIVQ